MGYHERTIPAAGPPASVPDRAAREAALDAAAPRSHLARTGRRPTHADCDRGGLSHSGYKARRQVLLLAAARAQRLARELAAARAGSLRAEAARGALAVENLRLHAGYAAALDRTARLMAERDALLARNAALRARLAAATGEATRG